MSVQGVTGEEQGDVWNEFVMIAIQLTDSEAKMLKDIIGKQSWISLGGNELAVEFVGRLYGILKRELGDDE